MAAPKLRELFMCKLTTPTTCYSATREVSSEEDSKAVVLHLATENHALEMTIHNLDGDDGNNPGLEYADDNLSFVEHSIPIPAGISRRIAKKLICVGYSEKDGWEAMVLLDTSKSQEHIHDHTLQSQQQDDERTNATRRRVSTTSASGGASVSSTNTDGTASMSSATSAASSAAAPTTTVVVPSFSENNASSKTKLANLMEEEGDDLEEKEEEHVQPVARLVLQHHQTRRRFTKPLDFRPLSPCISKLSSNEEGGSNQDIVVVWVGSSDDSKLRLFRNDPVTETLVEVPLEAEKTKEAASFRTPVMAVACLTPTQKRNPLVESTQEEEKKVSMDDSNNVLAVACQDGTIRFIGFEWRPNHILRYRVDYTVVVDGPIVCIHLVVDHNEGQLEAIVGSLCGYAARFSKSTSGKWQGPYMVAEGLGSPSQEDSVLAVHTWGGGDMVALGTYSGRCLLYGTQQEENREDEPDLPYWDFQLPDPIHGICHVPSTRSLITLLVTTSRSIHIFQEVPKVYKPSMAKQKLERLLSRLNQKNATASTLAPPTTQETTNPKELDEGEDDSGPLSPRPSASLSTEQEELFPRKLPYG